jgi:MinD-like ATPase involved in chromosome partitioning or flagellar assembly
VSIPVVTAVTGAPWESALVAGLEAAPNGLTLVRRCIDLPDLLAVAASGLARAVLLSAEQRRLDRELLDRLAASGVAVVVLHAPGDDAAVARVERLGLRHTCPADAPLDVLADTVAGAVSDLLAAPVGVTQSRTAAPAPAYDRADPPPHPGGPERVPGRLVAVWGPAGSPGRTSLAVGIAAELAHRRVPTVLGDVDVYGGTVASMLGLLDEAPGLAAAVRLSNNANLDLRALAGLAPEAAAGLRVLTGISRADRWPELRPAALEHVWALCRELAAVTVLDCAFCLEQDEELSFDTAAPRRNGATLLTLERADTVIAVGAADPIGVARLVRGLEALREVLPAVSPRVVLNRVRPGPVGPRPHQELAAALERYAGVRDVAFVPDDRAAFDAALRTGRTLAEAAPGSAARQALERLAAELVGRPAPRRRRRVLARAGR